MILCEFVCRNCRNEFEELVVSGGSGVSCPRCQSSQVERVLSAVKSRVGTQAADPGSAPGCAPSGGFS